MAASAFQLVRRRASGERSLAAVDATSDAEYSSSEPVERPGSQGLLLLLRGLMSKGYRPLRFTIVDSTQTELDEEAKGELASNLIDVLAKSGSDDEVLQYVWSQMQGLFLLSATLRDEELGHGTVTVNQNGLLSTNSLEEATRLPQVIAEIG